MPNDNKIIKEVENQLQIENNQQPAPEEIQIDVE